MPIRLEGRGGSLVRREAPVPRAGLKWDEPDHAVGMASGVGSGCLVGWPEPVFDWLGRRLTATPGRNRHPENLRL